MRDHNYFVYIITNPKKTVIYIGVTNDLKSRISQHYENRGNPETWAGKYYCHKLVYWERHQYIDDAIAREKEIKKWRREKKNTLIESINPNWNFLNPSLF